MSDRIESSTDIRSASHGMRKLKDDFFSLAAHEIRTPITVIKAQAQLAERFHAQGKLEGELIAKTLRVFVQESDRLSRICSDLLDIARLDSDCFDVKLSSFDVGEQLAETVARARARTDAHEIVFEGEGPLWVQGDRDRVAQALTSLLDNAVRYSPGGGVVVVSAARELNFVSISVADQGIGFAPEKISKLFGRYYQAHQDGLKGPAGLGLGLYLCRESISRMGGSIRAESAGLGQGARFTFTLIAKPLGDASS